MKREQDKWETMSVNNPVCHDLSRIMSACLFLVTSVIYQGQILKIFVKESIFLGHPFTHSLS